MNNQIPFFNPNHFPNPFFNLGEYDKLISKIEFLEKTISNLENRLKKIEQTFTTNMKSNDEPTDMYML